FLRGVKEGTLSVANCLRLAEVLGEEPPVIFRLARKPALADQFERLYGKTTNPMTEEERLLVTKWRAIAADVRASLRVTINAIPNETSTQAAHDAHTTPALPGASSAADRHPVARRVARTLLIEAAAVDQSARALRSDRQPTAAARRPAAGSRPP